MNKVDFNKHMKKDNNMRKFDSSKTRVNPLMDYLVRNDLVIDFIEKLMSKKDIQFDVGKINNLSEDVRYDCVGEKSYNPTKDRLIHLINNFNDDTVPKNSKKDIKKNSKRWHLLRRHQNTIKEAVSIVEENYDSYCFSKDSKWAILEGRTHPDIFIETTNAYFIGECKRTEVRPTIETTWCKNRDQLVRHIEPLLSTDKKVFYFYVWEKKDTTYRRNDKYYIEYFEMLECKNAFEDYLKCQLIETEHIDRVSEISASFLGHFTWNEINEKYNSKINYRP